MSQEWTTERMREVFNSVKNWGRWGADDEMGALNFITPAKRREAAAAVRHGVSVSLALELAVIPAPDNPFPALHMMVQGGDDCVVHGVKEMEGMCATSDFIGIAFHGSATTHIDALCHVLVDHKMYNGFSGDEVKSTGARRGSIMAAKDGIVSRGVLLDIPRLIGKKWVEPGDINALVTVAQLEAAEAAAGLKVSEGDILLIYLGRDRRRMERGAWNIMEEGMAGLHQECLPWLHKKGIAVLGSDGTTDPFPGSAIPMWPTPFHQCVLPAMGVHLIDNMCLYRLSDECAKYKQWDFQLTISPLRINRGTGSPVNPVALL